MLAFVGSDLVTDLIYVGYLAVMWGTLGLAASRIPSARHIAERPVGFSKLSLFPRGLAGVTPRRS
jgi:hypothetical protein